ncbi:MAG: cation transporter [Proteobacteria bacterium]|nr:cation transporter [Pseudomonadota bacterium]
MRKVLIAFVLAVCSSASLAAAPKQVVFQVKNMTCPACSITIDKALGKVSGVGPRTVDTRAETVTVSYDSDRTTEGAIAKAISDAGFPATVKPTGKH